MLIDITAAKKELLDNDNILILAHRNPDGDALGGAFALLRALRALGKNAEAACPDAFSPRYSFLYGEYKTDPDFVPGYIVAVDVAGEQLLGGLCEKYGDRIDLCIDHHRSNTLFAKKTLLDIEAPAACQLVYELLQDMGVHISAQIADALFLGISTDTGCFKYSSVTAKTHRAASELIALGADHAKINKLMFDTKSLGLMRAEALLTEKLEIFFGGKCAFIVLPSDLNERFGVAEDELDGISAIPIRIGGVLAGVTVRAKMDGSYRVSVRTAAPVDASEICRKLGGGGHLNAGGCTMTGELEEVRSRLLAAVEAELSKKS